MYELYTHLDLTLIKENNNNIQFNRKKTIKIEIELINDLFLCLKVQTD